MGGNSSKNGFGWSTTAEQAAGDVDLSGKIAIITGGNTGLGKETVRVLALHKAHVIIACRDIKKGNESINEIKKQNANADIECLELDLASLESIRQIL